MPAKITHQLGFSAHILNFPLKLSVAVFVTFGILLSACGSVDTHTATPIPIEAPTAIPTVVPTRLPEPTATPTEAPLTPTPQPTATPTETPFPPTPEPTVTPTETPARMMPEPEDNCDNDGVVGYLDEIYQPMETIKSESLAFGKLLDIWVEDESILNNPYWKDALFARMLELDSASKMIQQVIPPAVMLDSHAELEEAAIKRLTGNALMRMYVEDSDEWALGEADIQYDGVVVHMRNFEDKMATYAVDCSPFIDGP